MVKKFLATILFGAFLLSPISAMALQIPLSGNDLANFAGIRASAYAVVDAQNGEVLISKNPDAPKIPASLTKLVTALVVLDTKPKLSKAVAMTKEDQVVGYCGRRGVCIKSAAGVKFSVDGLFHASLILSANNAANALARSTGLTPEQFSKKMNAKAASLGATNSYFNEPTGLDPANVVTAADYGKILAAAFQDPYLRKIAGLSQYTLRSTNNSRYNQPIKNTNKLLGDADIKVLIAKTGYLDESRYNFSAVLKYKNGRELAIVVLGEDHLYTAYDETKHVARLGEEARALAFLNGLPAIFGTSTPALINN